MRKTVTAKEAADFLGISYWLVLEMAKRGNLPSIRCGKRVLFREETLQNWMQEQEIKSINLHFTENSIVKKIEI